MSYSYPHEHVDQNYSYYQVDTSHDYNNYPNYEHQTNFCWDNYNNCAPTYHAELCDRAEFHVYYFTNWRNMENEFIENVTHWGSVEYEKHLELIDLLFGHLNPYYDYVYDLPTQFPEAQEIVNPIISYLHEIYKPLEVKRNNIEVRLLEQQYNELLEMIRNVSELFPQQQKSFNKIVGNVINDPTQKPFIPQSISDDESVFIPAYSKSVEEDMHKNNFLVPLLANDQRNENDSNISILDNSNVDFDFIPSVSVFIEKCDVEASPPFNIDDRMSKQGSININDDVIPEPLPSIVVSPIAISNEVCDRSFEVEELKDEMIIHESNLTLLHGIPSLHTTLEHEIVLDSIGDNDFEVKKCENEVSMQVDMSILDVSYVDPIWENMMNAHNYYLTNVFDEFSSFYSPETDWSLKFAIMPLERKQGYAAKLSFFMMSWESKAMGVKTYGSLQNFRWDPGI